MKARHLSFIFLAVLIGTLVFVSGCAKKECEVKTDCGVDTKCMTYSCSIENKCIKTPKPNCCGNGKCDSAAGENSCTCADCGSCEKQGKVKYNSTSARGVKVLEAKFARFICEENACIVGISPDDVTPLKYVGNFEESNTFKLEILNTLNQPFNYDKDTLEVRLTLTDLNEKKVLGGILISKMQVLSSSNQVMGEIQVNEELVALDSIITENIPLNSPMRTDNVPEEELTVSLKVDYRYIPLDVKGNELAAQTKSIKQVISSGKLLFVKP